MNKELELIKEINNLETAKGLGDDCFIFDGFNKFLISTDAFFEDIHFRLDWLTPEEIGYRTSMAAISDIAAMGGKLKYLFNTISYNDNNIIKRILLGINKALKETNGTLAGGDLTGGNRLSVSITVIGESINPVKRTGSKIGDKIFVTGYLGESALGLWCLQNNITNQDAQYFIDKFKKPKAKLREGLNISKKATALIDTSDGLVSELFHLSKANHLGVELLNLPVSERLLNFCKMYKLDWENFVLYGGEDFELLYTANYQLLNTDLFIANTSKETSSILYNNKILSNKSFSHF